MNTLTGRSDQIRNNRMNNRFLIDIFNAAVAAVDPYPAVIRAITIEHNCLHAAGAAYELDTFNRILVVGAGKATAHDSHPSFSLEWLRQRRASYLLPRIHSEHGP